MILWTARKPALRARGLDAISAADLGLVSRVSERRAEPLNLEQAERELIRKALEQAGGNVSDAAKDLGLSRSGLYRRLQKYGLG